MRICSGRSISMPLSPSLRRARNRRGHRLAVRKHRLRRCRCTPASVTGRKFELPMKLATKRDAGFAYSSSPLPTCSMRPLLNTAIRSDRRSASSWSWVTYRIVTPVCWWMRLSSSLQFLAQLLVERGKRFVHQQHRRIVGERAGNRDALLHPARQLVRHAVAAIAEVHELEHLLDLRFHLRIRRAARAAETPRSRRPSDAETACSAETPCRCCACSAPPTAATCRRAARGLRSATESPRRCTTSCSFPTPTARERS
jgi:hypothetical protein